MKNYLDFGKSIRERTARILAMLPPPVQLVAAVKSRTRAEVQEAMEAGVTILGENYLQETAVHSCPETKHRARWHFIGNLQRNKVKRAVQMFDLIETVDSLKIATEIDRRAGEEDKIMEVLVEVNSGREPQKSGLLPEEVIGFVAAVADHRHLRIRGLMTMGPNTDNPAELKPCFACVRELAERIKAQAIPGVTMEYLSMGMSHSWETAVAEGANLVRLGTLLFGPRPARGA